MSSLSEGRSWAGRSLEDRIAIRRRRLLEAAADLMAVGGTAAAGVRAVCAQAGLTQRYFYESFVDRDALAAEVFSQAAGQARAKIVAAVGKAGDDPRAIAVAAVETVVALALDNPRQGQLLFIAPLSDPALYRRRDEVLPDITDLIRAQLPPGTSRAIRDLVATTLTGALGHLFGEYVAGHLDVPRQVFVDHCVEVLLRGAVLGAPRPVSAGTPLQE